MAHIVTLIYFYLFSIEFIGVTLIYESIQVSSIEWKDAQHH